MHSPPHGLGYGQRALQPWARRLLDWRAENLDTFVYFNNDVDGHAISDAQTLLSQITG
jgi:uncharacterized protein YecE (DUF72 family)